MRGLNPESALPSSSHVPPSPHVVAPVLPAGAVVPRLAGPSRVADERWGRRLQPRHPSSPQRPLLRLSWSGRSQTQVRPPPRHRGRFIDPAQVGRTRHRPRRGPSQERIARPHHHQGRGGCDAPAQIRQAADRGRGRSFDALDQAGRGVAEALVVHPARAARTARGEAQEVAAQRRRPLHPRSPGEGRDQARRRSGQGDLDPTGDIRSDRLSADHRRGRRLPRGPLLGRL